MKLTIEIPKEFEKEFFENRFKGTFGRINIDLNSNESNLCGKYEKETVQMLEKALWNAVVHFGE